MNVCLIILNKVERRPKKKPRLMTFRLPGIYIMIIGIFADYDNEKHHNTIRHRL